MVQIADTDWGAVEEKAEALRDAIRLMEVFGRGAAILFWTIGQW
jgi:hypothetical protein